MTADIIQPVLENWSRNPGLFTFVAVFVIVALLSKLPGVKGWFGEAIMRIGFMLFLPAKQYRVINNVTIPDGQGGTTQIDHVIVSIWGVFVVETKNYNGWIFGGERDRQWTQKIHGNHSQKFQNPLLQNYKHTESLRRLLELKKNQVKSVVVFMGNCSLKTRNKLPNHVTYPTECVQYIKGGNLAVLGDNQVDAIEAAIRERRLTSGWKTSRQHVSYVKELHHSPSQPAKEVCVFKTALGNKNSAPPAEKEKGRGCPKCGAEMVLRTARRGTHIGNKFWGCGNFPKCRKILEFQG